MGFNTDIISADTIYVSGNSITQSYKVYAAFYTLLEITNTQQSANPDQIITNKVTILEHLTAASIKESMLRDDVMEEIEKADKDIIFITHKILMEKFNTKYDSLNHNQKLTLKEYINSVDNTPRLKEFYTNKINEIKIELSSLNKKTKNQATKIKINEIISIINPPAKNAKVTDNDLVDLLQYYDLINELETVNG